MLEMDRNNGKPRGTKDNSFVNHFRNFSLISNAIQIQPPLPKTKSPTLKSGFLFLVLYSLMLLSDLFAALIALAFCFGSGDSLSSPTAERQVDFYLAFLGRAESFARKTIELFHKLFHLTYVIAFIIKQLKLERVRSCYSGKFIW